jgi:hypothetical protein
MQECDCEEAMSAVTRFFDRFLTGLTGWVFVGQSHPVYLVETVIFDRFDRFDRFFPHTHMRTTQSGVLSENASNPSNPSKPVKARAVA